MSLDMTALVVAALPSPDGGIEPPDLRAPVGITYRWVNTTILGNPDLETMAKRHDDGWTFVAVDRHPEALKMTLEEATAKQAFCLMERGTDAVQEQRAKERAAHMDVDIRVLNILERYTGETPEIVVGGVPLRASARKTITDGTLARPITTLDELRAELAKHYFTEADIRLFMQRHFGE